jgi:hypothetical protein
MKKRNLVVILALFVLASSLKAQNCDPWIAEAYKLMYKRSPTSAECNIKNYNNGSWRSKAELIGYIDAYNRNKPGDFLKGDPWIFQNYYELYSRIPTAFELNITLYNGGSWSDRDQLKGFIADYQKSLMQNDVNLIAGKANSKDAAVLVDRNNNVLAVSLISPNGGLVVAPGGANVIAAGGGNVVAPGGGNVIAPGGANFNFNANTPGLNVTAGYSTQSTGVKRTIKTAGKGGITIK